MKRSHGSPLLFHVKMWPFDLTLIMHFDIDGLAACRVEKGVKQKRVASKMQTCNSQQQRQITNNSDKRQEVGPERTSTSIQPQHKQTWLLCTSSEWMASMEPTRQTAPLLETGRLFLIGLLDFGATKSRLSIWLWLWPIRYWRESISVPDRQQHLSPTVKTLGR